MGYKHKYIKGLSIELIAPTKKGYKVLQTELYNTSGIVKLRTPKIKTSYFYDSEIKDFFVKDNNIQPQIKT